MNVCVPRVRVGEKYAARWDCAAKYKLTAVLTTAEHVDNEEDKREHDDSYSDEEPEQQPAEGEHEQVAMKHFEDQLDQWVRACGCARAMCARCRMMRRGTLPSWYSMRTNRV